MRIIRLKYFLRYSGRLSYHGQEGNIEMGTYMESPVIAQQVEDIFTKFLFSKIFVELK